MDQWIEVNESDESTLPPIGKVVLCVDTDGHEFFGGRGEDGDEWFWCIAYDIYWDKTYGISCYDLECDDVKTIRWRELK